MDLFQFMVGNVDYAVQNLHNVRLLKLEDSDYSYPVAIPYDFDYAGLINAPYAIPGDSWPIDNVRQRYYLGGCRDMTEFEEAFNLFRENREALEALFLKSQFLSEKYAKGPLNYIEDFYKILDSQSAVEALIVDNCH